MKGMTVTLRRLALDGASFITTAALTLTGLWGLFQIEASLFTLIIFGTLMMPALLSSATYLKRDINKATHHFIA